MIQGLITARHLFLHAPTIVRQFRGRGVVAVLAGHPAASPDDLSRLRLSFLALRFPMKTFVLPIAFAVLCAACGNHPSNETPAEARADLSAAKAPPASPVVEWNKALLQIVRTPGAQPATMHSTHSFAILHASIYDAVNSIDGTHAPYLVRIADASGHASQEAAAAAAGHAVLVALYPSFSAQLDAQLQQSLAEVADGARKTEGVRIGQEAADRLLALRAGDGSADPPIKYGFGTAPGDYQSTPPNFPSQPQLTNWSHVQPFALRIASQFRPGPPPALTSDAYSDAFNEIKTAGIAGSTTATADQALTGQFWNGAIQNYWNEIAQTVSLSHHLTTAQTARLFALLDLALADSVIAFYDAKYTYNLWRPVTAIRAADTDGNPDTSEVMPGVERSFDSLADAAREATLSRIFAGQHFRFDLTAGARLGREVAGVVLDGLLTPRDGKDDDR